MDCREEEAEGGRTMTVGEEEEGSPAVATPEADEDGGESGVEDNEDGSEVEGCGNWDRLGSGDVEEEEEEEVKRERTLGFGGESSEGDPWTT